MPKRWPAFTRFLDDGRICLSNNAAERDGVTAFTEYGIESLKQIIADERAASGARAK
jgi:hypothetical protein